MWREVARKSRQGRQRYEGGFDFLCCGGGVLGIWREVARKSRRDASGTGPGADGTISLSLRFVGVAVGCLGMGLRIRSLLGPCLFLLLRFS